MSNKLHLSLYAIFNKDYAVKFSNLVSMVQYNHKNYRNTLCTDAASKPELMHAPKPEFLTTIPPPCNAALKHENLRKIGFRCRIKTRENGYFLIAKISYFYD